MPKKLLSLGTDRLLFQEGSAVRARFAEYAKDYEEIHVVVATDRSFTESFIAPNVWVYPTLSKVKAFYPLDMIRLGRFIIEKRGITEITCQDPFLTGMAGISLRKASGLPLEIQLHTDIGSPKYPQGFANKIRKALALSYLPKADHIRVVSPRIKKYLTDRLGIAEQKIEVRPIVVDTEWVKSAPITVDIHKKYPQFTKVALMASRLESEKNISLALKAWPGVLDIAPKAGLIIVGSGSEEKRLKVLVERLGLEASVVFEPWADKSTLASYYKTADVFLNTSFFEGYGMTLVEAKAAGCRIVSTDVGVAREQEAVIVGWDTSGVTNGIIKVFGV